MYYEISSIEKKTVKLPDTQTSHSRQNHLLGFPITNSGSPGSKRS